MVAGSFMTELPQNLWTAVRSRDKTTAEPRVGISNGDDGRSDAVEWEAFSKRDVYL